LVHYKIIEDELVNPDWIFFNDKTYPPYNKHIFAIFPDIKSY